MRDALVDTVQALPAHLERSLTCDQSSEMGRHHEFSIAADMLVYFCAPASPWQRGSNENINGPLRQYFPQGHRPVGPYRWTARHRRRPTQRQAFEELTASWAEHDRPQNVAAAPQRMPTWTDTARDQPM